jgi:voltage-gated potassium channel
MYDEAMSKHLSRERAVSKYAAVKARVYQIVDVIDDADTGEHIFDVFDIFIAGLIVVNVLASIVGTVPSIHARVGHALYLFEIVSVAIFTLEYILRVWSCTARAEYAAPVLGRVRFMLSGALLVDILAILPFYAGLVFPGAAFADLRFIRALRLLRILRLLKLGRYSSSIRTLIAVLRAKREQLMVAALAMVVLLVLASSILFYAENEAQPEMFASIPAAMWWVASTVTTLGCDMAPVTLAGKLLAVGIALLGIGLFALPAGILGSGFVEAARQTRHQAICPHCGKPTDSPE